VDRAEDEECRWRGERFDENVDRLIVPGDAIGTRFRPLARQKLGCVGLDYGVEGGVSQTAECLVGQDQELRADLTAADNGGDGHRNALGERLLEAALDLDARWRETGHSVTGSTKTSIVPPQASPTSQAISSLMP
jgi:hypothetical protein